MEMNNKTENNLSYLSQDINTANIESELLFKLANNEQLWQLRLCKNYVSQWSHMGVRASQITDNSIVFSTVVQANNIENINTRITGLLCGVSDGMLWFPHTKGQ